MREEDRHTRRGRPRQPAPKTLPDDFFDDDYFDYEDDPVPISRMQPEDTPLLGADGQRMRVIDDWPDDVPVTEAEIEVFKRWFGDVFDELLSPKMSQEDLRILSDIDKKKP